MADPFEVLGVEARYDLDLDKLAERHRDLSKALHPDKYARASANERRMALSRAIDVNEAYRVLKDPVKRAEALLKKRGVELTETNEPKPPPSLLMEMMEAREELADARKSKDLGAAQRLGKDMELRMKNVVGDLQRAFATGADDSALPALGELRYVRRFLDEVRAIEEELAT